MNIIILIFSLALSMLTGCIEVKNTKDEAVAEQSTPTPSEKSVETVSDLLVDEPLYLFRGEVLSEPEFKAEVAKGNVWNEPEAWDYHFKNLKFQPGGILYTNGDLVHLYAQHILSDFGVISTFPSNQVAENLHIGRSGGSIAIMAPTAEGRLTLIMRGEKGGQGKGGSDPDDSLRGDPGRTFAEADKLNQSLRPGQESYTVRGFPGKRGYPGERGLEGGNSGRFKVEIPSAKDFELEVMAEPGEGGDGGPGGRGGEGGKHGDLWPGPEPRGETGPRGLIGPEGLKGAQDPGVTILNNLPLNYQPVF